MIHTWWFQLYTKKNLTKIASLLPLFLILDLVLPAILQGICLLIIGVILFWLLFKFFSTLGQMRENYELLNNSFTVKEIISSFFLHSFISSISLVLILHLTYFIMEFTDGIIFREFREIVGYLSIPYLYFSLYFLSFIQLAYSLHIVKEIERGKKTMGIMNSFVGFVGIGTTTIGCFFIGGILYAIGFNEILIFYILVMGGVLYSLSTTAVFLMRESEFLMGFKGTFRGILGNLIFCIPFLLIASYLSSLTFYDSNLNADQKAFRYELGSPFIVLDRQGLIDVYPRLDNPKVKIDFDLNHEDPDFFLKNKLFPLLYRHIKKGEATPEFLTRLYDDFEAQESQWDKYSSYRTLKLAAFDAWPQDQELPERFIKEKQSLREIANESKD